MKEAGFYLACRLVVSGDGFRASFRAFRAQGVGARSVVN